jgi:hypothetical protein
MKEREVNIRKVENGYVLKTVILQEDKSKHIDAMLNLLKTAGVYERWQEHKEEDFRRALEKMIVLPTPQRQEQEVICSSMAEVMQFIKRFFEETPQDPISL